MNAELMQNLFDGVKAGAYFWAGQKLENNDIAIPDGGTLSPLVDACLESDFDSEIDGNMKKAMAAAQLISHATGDSTLPSVSAIGLASIADEAIESAKTIFKLSTDQISLTQASDRMIDVATTRLVGSVDFAVEAGVNYVSSTLVPEICAAYPPVTPVVIAASVFLQKAKPVIKDFVKKAIPKIAEKVKELSHPLIEKAKEIAKILLGTV